MNEEYKLSKCDDTNHCSNYEQYPTSGDREQKPPSTINNLNDDSKRDYADYYGNSITACDFLPPPPPPPRQLYPEFYPEPRYAYNPHSSVIVDPTQIMFTTQPRSPGKVEFGGTLGRNAARHCSSSQNLNVLEIESKRETDI